MSHTQSQFWHCVSSVFAPEAGSHVMPPTLHPPLLHRVVLFAAPRLPTLLPCGSFSTTPHLHWWRRLFRFTGAYTGMVQQSFLADRIVVPLHWEDDGLQTHSTAVFVLGMLNYGDCNTFRFLLESSAPFSLESPFHHPAAPQAFVLLKQLHFYYNCYPIHPELWKECNFSNATRLSTVPTPAPSALLHEKRRRRRCCITRDETSFLPYMLWWLPPYC